MKSKLTRDDILLPVLAAWAHDEISIGRARELLHMPDDKIRAEAEKRVSNAVKEKEYRDAMDSENEHLKRLLKRCCFELGWLPMNNQLRESIRRVIGE